eukprot:tig00021621_g22985.t1
MARSAKRRRLEESVKGNMKRVESSISDLSDELLAHIFSFISLEEAWPLRRVCKAWRKVIQVSLKSSSVQLSNVALSFITLKRSQADAFGLWGNAVGVLSAIASQHAGRGPTNVSLDYSLNRFEENFSNESLASAAESFVLAPLAALKPSSRTGSDAPAALEELSLFVEILGQPENEQPLHQEIADTTLRTALAPFSNLQSLELPTGWFLLGGAQAAVLAECCPRLTKLTMTAYEAAAVASLAPLPLEELMLSGHPFDIDIGGSLTALAAGAAGRTLERLSGQCYEINGDDLRALARLPELRDFKSFHVNDDVSREDVAALGAAPKLRDLSLLFESQGEAAPFLYGLADAVRASRSLKELSLELHAANGTDPAALADFVGASAGILQSIIYGVKRALTAEEVAALAACTRVHGFVTCALDGIADLFALQGLRGTRNRIEVSMLTGDPLLRGVANGVISTWLNSRGYTFITIR